jgi:xanthine dehydrogenase accessory factor
MRDVIPDISRWLAEGKKVVLATVVKTWGSAPRKVGAHMGISQEGEITGSVSGGCVEGAVIATTQEVLESGAPQLLHFGVADEEAWEVGLACGGEIEVFVQLLDAEIYQTLARRIQDEQLTAYTTVIKGSEGWLGHIKVLEGEASKKYPFTEQVEVAGQSQETFTNVILPSPRVIMIGGSEIANALAQVAEVLNYQVIGIESGDPLEPLAVNETTAIVILTDNLNDDPALSAALNSKAVYIGVLGSKEYHADRVKRLKEAGVSEEQIARIHAPVGLDIQAESPEETAIAIMAEIVAVQRGVRS